jgi:hypothetical protein
MRTSLLAFAIKYARDVPKNIDLMASSLLWKDSGFHRKTPPFGEKSVFYFWMNGRII